MANYSELTTKELRTLCKENGIAYNTMKDGVKHTMTKDEMVNALYDFEEKQNAEPVAEEKEEVAEVKEVKVEEVETTGAIGINESASIEELLKARDEIDAIIKHRARIANSAVDKLNHKKTQRDVRNEQYDENWSMYGGVDPNTFIHTRNKELYIEKAEVGTLIAFLDENGKPRTAALVNRSSERKVVKVKTEYDWEFIVPYDSILWVRKGDKWAYGVYRILKGYNPNGKCGSENSKE